LWSANGGSKKAGGGEATRQVGDEIKQERGERVERRGSCEA